MCKVQIIQILTQFLEPSIIWKPYCFETFLEDREVELIILNRPPTRSFTHNCDFGARVGVHDVFNIHDLKASTFESWIYEVWISSFSSFFNYSKYWRIVLNCFYFQISNITRFNFITIKNIFSIKIYKFFDVLFVFFYFYNL